MERIEIRKRIQEKGRKVYEETQNQTLSNMVGEIMALNEEYVLNHQGEGETYATVSILNHGFTRNQLEWIKELKEVFLI